MANEYQAMMQRASQLLSASQAVHKELCLWMMQAERLQMPVPRSTLNVMQHMTADLRNLDLELRELLQS